VLVVIVVTDGNMLIILYKVVSKSRNVHIGWDWYLKGLSCGNFIMVDKYLLCFSHGTAKFTGDHSIGVYFCSGSMGHNDSFTSLTLFGRFICAATFITHYLLFLLLIIN
jgi:hypothetical protein